MQGRQGNQGRSGYANQTPCFFRPYEKPKIINKIIILLIFIQFFIISRFMRRPHEIQMRARTQNSWGLRAISTHQSQNSESILFYCEMNYEGYFWKSLFKITLKQTFLGLHQFKFVSTYFHARDTYQVGADIQEILENNVETLETKSLKYQTFHGAKRHRESRSMHDAQRPIMN